MTVRTGKVQVSKEDGKKFYIEPDQCVTFDAKSSEMTAGVASGKNAADWRNGRIVLDNATFAEIALRVSQHYGVEVVNHAGISESTKVYLAFNSKTSIEDVAQALSDIYHTKYKFIENKIILS